MQTIHLKSAGVKGGRVATKLKLTLKKHQEGGDQKSVKSALHRLRRQPPAKRKGRKAAAYGKTRPLHRTHEKKSRHWTGALKRREELYESEETAGKSVAGRCPCASQGKEVRDVKTHLGAKLSPRSGGGKI